MDIFESLFAEEKQNAKDKAYDKFAEIMIKRIEEMAKKKGKENSWDCPWFRTTGIMPQNIDGRIYNGMNLFMLFLVTEMNNYTAPIFATWDKIKSLNYKDKKPAKDKDGNKLPFVNVNKGEKSFPVFIFLFSVKHKATGKKITFDEYNKLDDDEKKDYDVNPRMSVYNVFNIDQTNLKETRPDLYNKLISKNKVERKENNGFRNAIIDKMINDNLWVCPINVKKSNEAFYRPSTDSITIPLYEDFKTGEAFYSTCIHEMAHSTGKDDRLNRNMKNRFGDKEYGREELVAEMTAALICNMLGIQNGVDKESVKYLSAWCKNIKEEPDYIKTVMKDVKNAYNFISAKIDEVSSINASEAKKSKKSKRA